MKKNLSAEGVTTLFFAMLILIVAAGSTLAKAESVKVGVIVPLTGPFARYGAKTQEAILSVADRSVTFVFEDEGCDPKIAVNAYKKLSEIDGINIFLGPGCGSSQSAIAPLLKRKNHLAILGSSAPEAVFIESDGRMFSAQHSIEDESSFLGSKLNEHGISSVVIFFKENAFSRAHEAAFRSRFKGKILSTFAYTSEDTSELKGIALKVKQLQPDALYVPDAFPLMSGLMKELKATGAQRKIYSIYSSQSEDVLKVLGVDGETLIYSYPDIGGLDALRHFPTLAAKILVAAIKTCGSDVSCVRDAMMKRNSFNSHGVLGGDLKLKTILSGRFVAFPPGGPPSF